MFKCLFFYDQSVFVSNLPDSSKCWDRLVVLLSAVLHASFLLLPLTISLYIGFRFKIS